MDLRRGSGRPNPPLVAVLLFLCLLAPCPSVAYEVAISDGFDAGLANWQVLSGNWLVTDGVCHADNTGSMLLAQAGPWTDYKFSVKLRDVTFTGDGRHPGFFFNYRDTTHYEYFYFRVHWQQWVHARVDGGSGVVVATGSHASASGQWNTFHVTQQNGACLVSIDGQQVHQFNSPWTGGKVGLLGLGSAVEFDDAVVDQQDPLAKTIVLTSPNGGQTFADGQQGVPVTWTSSGSISQVEIWIGRRAGTTYFDWKQLATATANDGQENVNLPAGVPGSDWIFFVGTPDYAVYDVSDATVTIQGTARAITLTSPNGGQTFADGQQGVPVTWTSSGSISQVEIWIGRRAGATYFDWKQLTTATANDGQENVNLPAGVPGSDWIFFVGTPDYAVYDVSDATVTIQGTARAITLTAPNGGQTFTNGQKGIRITWTSSGSISQVEIWMGRRAGSAFSDWRQLAVGTANDGQEEVNLPAGVTGSDWVFFVSTPDYSVYDTSDGTVTIQGTAVEAITLLAPNGGETLAGGQAVQVTWISSGSIGQVEIWMGRREGTTFSSWQRLAAATANDGQETVNLPAGVTGSDWVFFVSEPDYSVYDTSDGTVTIQARTITLTAPNGGETFTNGQQRAQVTWTSSGNIGQVEIWMGRRAGTTFSSWHMLAAATANDGQEEVNLPAGVTGSDWAFYVSTPDYSVYDTSDGTVTIDGTVAAKGITLIAPNGGETFTGGQQRVRVAWTSSGNIGQVEVWMGRRSGNTFSSWQKLVAATANDGQEDVNLPAGITGSDWVVYVSTPDYSVYDTSDGTLTMVESTLVASSSSSASPAGFEWGGTGGSGTFQQYIPKATGYDGIYVGEIPSGLSGVQIALLCDTDVDVQLYDKQSGEKIVAWPDGILMGAEKQTTNYQGVAIEYSGYNGDGTGKGHEYIKIGGTTNRAFVMKAYGFAAGNATVNYSWGGAGKGSFTGTVAYREHKLVGGSVEGSTIPVGLENVTITLTADVDVDVELWCGDTMVVGWNGTIDSPVDITRAYNGDTISTSGWNGFGGNEGKESISIAGKGKNIYVMKVFGFVPGAYTVEYEWGPWAAAETINLIVACLEPYTYSRHGEFRQAIRDCSNRLYDATNGQMRIGTVTYYSAPSLISQIEADVVIQRSHPEGSHVDLCGIPWPFSILSEVHLVTQTRSAGIDRSAQRLSHVLVHELGHYLFHLRDEYRKEDKSPGSCEIPSASSCVMDMWLGAGDLIPTGVDSKDIPLTEFCTSETHSYDNHQHQYWGGSCWAKMKSTYGSLSYPQETDHGPCNNENIVTNNAYKWVGALVHFVEK